MARPKKTYIEDGKLDANAAFDEFIVAVGQPALFKENEFNVSASHYNSSRQKHNTSSGERMVERVSVTLELTRIIKP